MMVLYMMGVLVLFVLIQILFLLDTHADRLLQTVQKVHHEASVATNSNHASEETGEPSFAMLDSFIQELVVSVEIN